jgi:hypothetical protein
LLIEPEQVRSKSDNRSGVHAILETPATLPLQTPVHTRVARLFAPPISAQ